MLKASSMIALFGVAAGVAVALLDPFQLGPSAAPVAGLVLGAIALYATGAVAEHITALLFFALAMIFAIAPASLVFSGFASTAFWLVLSGLVIGLSVNKTGLGARMAHVLARLFPSTYSGVLAGVVSVALLLSFFMPSSMGRIVLLMPIALALADRYGLAEGRTGRYGIALATGFACFNAPNGIMPATVPNMVFVGAVEKIYGFAPLYGEWMILHFPLLGLGKAVAIWAAARLLFRDTIDSKAESEPLPPITSAEIRLGLVLLATFIGWSTDVIHGISPAWIGLAAALFCLAPGIGFVPKDGFKQLNMSPLFYLAGILALGALIGEAGLGARLGAVMAEALPLQPGAAVQNFFSLVLGGGALSLLATMPGLPAVMVPLVDSLREASGLPLETVLASVVLSYSTTILPYQAPPIVIAVSMANARLADATKLVVTVAVISLLIILPLTFLWWRVLGMI